MLFLIEFFYYMKMNKFFLIIFGTIISISSSNWMISWLGMEINLISLISYMYKMNNFYSIESLVIYFLFQSFASLMFMMLIIINNFKYLMLFFMAMKIGSAPFHFWMIYVLENLEWKNSFIIMFWQKIAPFFIIFNCLNKFIYLLIIFSSLFSFFGGMNQISLRKIFGFSSINHISWLMLSILISKLLFFYYLFFYFFILMILLFFFLKYNFFYLNQIFLKIKNFYLKMLLMINMLSLGGLPPFLGFFPKMLVIKFNYHFFMIFFMIFFSLMILLFYIHIMYFILFLIFFNFKNFFNLSNFFINKILNLNFINNFMLYFFIFLF